MVINSQYPRYLAGTNKLDDPPVETGGELEVSIGGSWGEMRNIHKTRQGQRKQDSATGVMRRVLRRSLGDFLRGSDIGIVHLCGEPQGTQRLVHVN